jgi:hypothetical protein
MKLKLDINDPRVLLPVHPPRPDHQPVDGEGRVRNAGHLRDPRIEHHGLSLRLGSLQCQGVRQR